MRNLIAMKRWSVCLIAAAAAACANPADNNKTADANAAGGAENAAGADTADANAASADNIAAPAQAAANSSGGSDESYHASGVDPYWALAIVGGGQMVYTTPDGPTVTVATPAQQPTRNGYRYVTPELTVGVVHRQCQGVDEHLYADTVHVLVNGRTVRGCGE